MKTVKEYLLEQVAEKKLAPEEAITYLQQLGSHEPSSHPEIALLGMACRLPGARSPEELWQHLVAKRDLVNAFPKSRIDDVRYVNKKIFDETRGLNCRTGTYLDRIDLFDSQFFGFTPAEARVMDPAQRIFLEVAIEALEHAGLTEDELKGSKTGIYVGYSVNDDNYIDILAKDDPNVLIGNQPAMLAYRLSFMFDLRGPTMLIDTSCSSSLVAIHQACQAIESGDCDQAIVGGVNLRIFPAIREIANLGIEAFDGRCKTFDEKANGTNIGEGIACIVIKRKDLAEKDRNTIYALVKGTAVNSDGASNGITSPNPEAQMQVICKAWDKAGINPEQLAFIESHGTGTKLGDPIEISGLTHAFKKYTDKKGICPLGALKTNIGHLEATAGIAGFIKTVLALSKHSLPPNIHFHTPNPFIDFANSAVYPNVDQKELSSNNAPLLAAISSFGISGTNCHVVVEEYKSVLPQVASNGPHLLFVSAKCEESLKMNLASLRDYLKTQADELLPHISYTLAVGRNHYAYRAAVVCSTVQEAEAILTQALENSGEVANFYMHDTRSSTMAPVTNSSPYVDQYLSGRPVLWKRLYTSKELKKIALPPYQFFSKRHWPKLEVEKKHDVKSRLNSLYYDLEWKQEEKSTWKSLNLAGQTWLFLVHSCSEHDRFVAQARLLGIEAITVYPGSGFLEESKTSYTIDPRDPDHYKRVCEAAVIRGIFHMWDCKPVDDAFTSYKGVGTSQDESTFSTFHLVRALRDELTAKECKLITLSSYAELVGAEGEDFDPTRMPSLGLNKVVSQEFPKVQSLAIDVDFDHFDDATIDKIIHEVFDQQSYQDPFVAFRNGKRYVQILERKNIESLPDAPFTIRENGVYLIAGGAGYLGLESARYLSQKARVKIALVGRKSEEEFSEKQQRIVSEIRASGSQVIYLQGDTTNERECTAIVSSVVEQLGPINGIFVAIKNVSHELIENISFDRFKANVLAKLQVIWLLDELTKEYKPDFMATFSSISSLTGGPTGADCCAQNLFLDSFGKWRNEEGRYTVTMNYTLIEADDTSLLSDRMSMIPPVTKDEFLACLDLFLTKRLPFAVVADFDSHVMGLVLPFMKIRFSDKIVKTFTVEETAKDTKVDYSLDEIKAVMGAIWKDILGYSEIADNAGFFDLGGDSISAVKLIHLVKVQLQVELDVADLYSYSLFSELCGYIHAKTQKQPLDQIAKLLDDLDMGKIDVLEAVDLIK